MVSWYHFWTQSRWVAFAVPEVASRIKAYRDFDHCLTAERRLPSPQCASLFDDAGNPLVENILRFENLQEDFNRLMPQLGLLPATLGRINVSRHRHYRDYYNSKTKRIMAEQYYDDIEQLDYRF